MQTNKLVLTGLIILIPLSLLIGIFLGTLFKSDSQFELNQENIKTDQRVNSYEQGLTDGWKLAEERVKESSLCHGMEDFEIMGIVGRVVAFNQNSIKIKINPLEPLSDPELDEREIKINDQTLIKYRKEKEAEVYDREMLEYNQKYEQLCIRENPGDECFNLIMPEFFVMEEGDLSLIKEGVLIETLSDYDVRNEKSFSAVEIIVSS